MARLGGFSQSVVPLGASERSASRGRPWGHDAAVRSAPWELPSGQGVVPRLWLLVALISQALVGPVLRALNLTAVIFYHVVSLLKNEWSLSFPPRELKARVCVAHEASRCMLLG